MVKWFAHISLGIGGALFILDPDISTLFVVGVFSTLGSILPDLDLKLKHRRMLHNIPFMLTLLLIISILLYKVLEFPTSTVSNIAYPILIGYLLHIVADSFTRMGTWPLWPLSSRRLVLAEFDYDDAKLNTLIFILGLTLTLYYLYHKLPIRIEF